MPITATVTRGFTFATGTEVGSASLNQLGEPTVEVPDQRITDLENSATGIVDGGRAALQYVEATDINGGSASL